MTAGSQLGLVESMVQALLAAEPEYFLVDLRIKPTNNIKIFLDGDHGITIEKCVQFNRALYKKIEEAAVFPDGDYSLELSSPGLDEPLKKGRQYKKNIGRQVEVLLEDGTKKEGLMVDVSEEGIVLEETLGRSPIRGAIAKKREKTNHALLFNNIKSTKIQVVF